MSYSDVALALKLQFPREFISLSRGFTSTHKGIDMCWSSSYGGQNAPIYAPADGTVVAIVDGKGNDTSGAATWGNYIKIKHADGVYTLMGHCLKWCMQVKVGDKVKRGQYITNMNNSGYSFGSHIHYEVYVGGSGTGYRVDPLKYTFAWPGQTVGSSSECYSQIQHYSPTTYVGTPVARDTTKDQLEVIVADLNGRNAAGTAATKLGFVNKGFYNILVQKSTDGYTWYQLETKLWVAYNAEWETLYAKEDTKDKKIRELEAQVAALTETCAKYKAALNSIKTTANDALK